MALFLYIFMPIFLLWLILRKVIGTIRARTAIFFIVMILFLHVFCFVAGLFFSFWFEPESYWHSMNFDFSWWDAHAFPPGASLAHVFNVPYLAMVFFLRCSIYVLSTHFTWGFAISYACGLFILFNWWSAAVSAWRMRDPRYGF